MSNNLTSHMALSTSPQQPPKTDQDSDGLQPKRGSMLVIDDSRTSRNALVRHLKREGYTVSVAEDGQQALEMLKVQQFDLLLLDVMMPGLNGYQVLERLKAHQVWSHIPVIMISGVEEIESAVKCIEMGAEDYLNKPFDPVLLRARIGACLEKKWLRDKEVEYLLRIKKEKELSEKLLHVVIPIGVALPAEKDFNRLLEMIVLKAKALCNAEAGMLYLRTKDDCLEFVIIRDDPLGIALGGTTGKSIPYPPLAMYAENTGKPNESNIATYVALNGASVNIANAKQSAPFDLSGVRAFDQKDDCQAQSLLTIPLKNNVERVIGVLQLLDAKEPETGQIVPFDDYLQQMIESLSALAATALEVYILEQSLRQQIKQLHIEIDEARKAHQVAEITETEYFQKLRQVASEIRKGNKEQ